MSETKWTPGPWEVSLQDRYLGGDCIITGRMQPSNGETDIAAVFGGKVRNRTMANARLIAAAPELYEALNALLHATMYRDHPTESEMAKRALAKASGPADERPPQAPTGESNAAD